MLRKIMAELLALGRAAVCSWRLHRRLLLWCLLGGMVACCGVVLFGVARGKNPLYYFTDFACVGFGGVMTLVSGQCLGTAGVLLLVRAWQRESAGLRTVLGWALLGGGAIALSADEVLLIHEHETAALATLGIPKVFGALDQDVYVFIFYGLAAAALLVMLWSEILSRPDAVFPLVAAGAFFAASEAVDFIPWRFLSSTQQAVLGPLEEILKTMGSWSLLLYGAILVARADTAANVNSPVNGVQTSL